MKPQGGVLETIRQEVLKREQQWQGVFKDIESKSLQRDAREAELAQQLAQQSQQIASLKRKLERVKCKLLQTEAEKALLDQRNTTHEELLRAIRKREEMETQLLFLNADKNSLQSLYEREIKQLKDEILDLTLTNLESKRLLKAAYRALEVAQLNSQVTSPTIGSMNQITVNTNAHTTQISPQASPMQIEGERQVQTPQQPAKKSTLQGSTDPHIELRQQIRLLQGQNQALETELAGQKTQVAQQLAIAETARQGLETQLRKSQENYQRSSEEWGKREEELKEQLRNSLHGLRSIARRLSYNKSESSSEIESEGSGFALPKPHNRYFPADTKLGTTSGGSVLCILVITALPPFVNGWSLA